MLREYRFHNSYQYDERQMLNEKNLLVVTSCKLTEESDIQSTVFLDHTDISIKTFTFITASCCCCCC